MIHLSKYVKKTIYDATMNTYLFLNKDTVQRDITVGNGGIENYKNNGNNYELYKTNLTFNNVLMTKKNLENLKSKNLNIIYLKNVGENEDEISAVPYKKSLKEYNPNLSITLDYAENYASENNFITTGNTNLITKNMINERMFNEFEIYISDFTQDMNKHTIIIYNYCEIFDVEISGNASIYINQTLFESATDLIGKKLNPYNLITPVYNENENAYMILYLFST